MRLVPLTVWFALITAMTELLLRGIAKYGLHRYLYVGRDIVWMTPLADLLVFAVVALLLRLLAVRWPNLLGARGAVSVLAFIGSMSVLCLQPWMAWWAMWCLAIGVGIQAGRLAALHERFALGLVRRTLPVLLAAFVILIAAVTGRRLLTERRAMAALPAAPAGAPNVILIVWDAVRAQDVSAYGYERRTTPTLEALASRGVAFDRAVATGSYTLPGHIGLFSGRWAHQVDATWLTPFDGHTPTLAEALAARGWRTGAFSANRLFVSWEHGVLRGFIHAEDYPFSWGELTRCSALLKRITANDPTRTPFGLYDKPGRLHAADIRRHFLAWVDRDPSRPFFAFMNIFDAHEPYLPGAPYDTLFGFPKGAGPAETRRVKLQSLGDRLELSDADLARQRDLYDGGIAEADHDLSLLLGDLERRHLLQNTLIIIAGDHGEEFREHGTTGHGNDLYWPAVHVPLVMSFPARLPAGVRVPGVVSLRDVPATVASLLGATGPGFGLPGASLERFWARGAGHETDTVLTEIDQLPSGERPWFPVRRGPVRSMVAWPWQLIVGRDSVGGRRVELFDLDADIAQRSDLAAAPGHAATRDALLAAMQRWRQDAVATKRD